MCRKILPTDAVEAIGFDGLQFLTETDGVGDAGVIPPMAVPGLPAEVRIPGMVNPWQRQGGSAFPLLTGGEIYFALYRSGCWAFIGVDCFEEPSEVAA